MKMLMSKKVRPVMRFHCSSSPVMTVPGAQTGHGRKSKKKLFKLKIDLVFRWWISKTKANMLFLCKEAGIVLLKIRKTFGVVIFQIHDDKSGFIWPQFSRDVSKMLWNYSISGVESGDFSNDNFQRKFFKMGKCRYNSAKVFEHYFVRDLRQIVIF